MNSSFEILEALKKEDLLKDTIDENWWPNSGTFEVIVGAILTQQTKWQKVEKSLENLREQGVLELEKLAQIDGKVLATLIKPSGFYNTKAKRLKDLCKAIVRDFGDFENFQKSVSREWLLEQKGVGEESADAILCYACFREVFVVDNYTNKLLKSLGYEFESYMELQEWMVSGIESNLDKVYTLYDSEVNLSTIYSRFHGKIVEFSKSKKDIQELTWQIKQKLST
jgi:endonuclease-3 related protein